MPKQSNIDTVDSIKTKLAKAKAMIVADYRGLTHKQAEDFHKALKKVGGEFLVAKNSLLRIASEDTEFKLQKTDLVGPSGALLSYEDEITPLKELSKLVKTLNLPVVKFGFIGGNRYDANEIDKIAKLPAKSVLQGQLVSQLNSPLYGLAYSLNYNLQKLVYTLGQIKK